MNALPSMTGKLGELVRIYKCCRRDARRFERNECPATADALRNIAVGIMRAARVVKRGAGDVLTW